MANNELKPCPFCGESKAKVYHNTNSDHRHNWDFHVECECGAVSLSDKQEAQAVAAWNRRAAPAQAEPSDALPELPEKVAIRAGHSFPKVYALGHTDDGLRAYAKQAIEARILGQQGGGDAARLSGLTRYEEYGNESGGGLQEASDGDFVRLDDVLAAIQAQAGDAGEKA